MKSNLRKGLSLQINQSPSVELINSTWNEVVKITKINSPFLCPEWISSWVAAVSYKPHLVVCELNSLPVGVCLLGVKTDNLAGIQYKTALLNQTGLQNQDQVWIEYNDIICAPQFKSNFIALLIDYLSKENIDLFHVSMAEKSVSRRIKASIKSNAESQQVIGYKAELSTDSTLLKASLLSKNTRAQIQRSNRKLESLYGPLKVKSATSHNERLQFLEAIGTLHKKQWQDSPHGSGFSNPTFVKQQQALILDNTNFANIFSVSAGKTILGYCIFLFYNNEVFFYCSGIAHHLATSHIKPGYTMHICFMEYFSKQGFTIYDFLGGEARYKQSLSSTNYSFESFTIPTYTMKGRLISIMYKLRQKIRTYTQTIGA